ncbi:unnamed protein product [marine sediment metagenome]|uniref:Glycosyltransferase 2-like domain-containing protein n=1 Tax=marine sediment metagenome TaxID=412755 RepID=X1H2T6_9ZZZZ
MNKKPFISIVLYTCNEEKYIKGCLDALSTQDYPKDRYEIIVVDDGSTDRTNEIVSKYSVKVTKHRKNLGIGSARNTGLRNANVRILRLVQTRLSLESNRCRLSDFI